MNNKTSNNIDCRLQEMVGLTDFFS